MRSTRKVITVVLAAIATFGLLFTESLIKPVSAQRAEQRLITRAQQITGDSFRVYVRTPRGAHVFARVPPRPEVLGAIDNGLSDLFNIARRHGYRSRVDHSHYTVFIGRADRVKDSTGAYSPDIAVGAAQYAGSGYDQGGYVYAAGMVMSYNPNALIIAEHDRDMQRVSNVVRYEGEHLILFHNDRGLFGRTADHSRGGSHPILQ